MAEAEVRTEAKQYIVVKFDDEQYGIDIGYIDNIVVMQRITRVPMAQPYFKGVINLRGEVIPIMSMRLKFGLEPDVITNKSRIIIIKTDQQALIGILVDEVKEVVKLEEGDIEKLERLCVNIQKASVCGLGQTAPNPVLSTIKYFHSYFMQIISISK